MKITLKPGHVLTRDHNHHGLTLATWQALEAGQAVEVEAVPATLAGAVDVDTPAKAGSKGKE